MKYKTNDSQPSGRRFGPKPAKRFQSLMAIPEDRELTLVTVVVLKQINTTRIGFRFPINIVTFTTSKLWQFQIAVVPFHRGHNPGSGVQNGDDKRTNKRPGRQKLTRVDNPDEDEETKKNQNYNNFYSE